MFMNIGEVREPSSEDFKTFKSLCEDELDWTIQYNKTNMKVSTKTTSYSEFKMFKIYTVLKQDPQVLYDVLQDAQYRPLWDKNIVTGFPICKMAGNSDIGYYALKSPLAFKNRDFVTQRCWAIENDEYMIFNHSVFHKKMPPKKDFVRGISFVTGYKIKRINKNESELIYITQSNPRGYIPAWAINACAKYVIPKVVDRFYKASLKYDNWKKRNNPDVKPWENPEQNTCPLIDFDDILSSPDIDINVVIEENIQEPTKFEDGDFDID